jgi:hypothetical protein
MDTTSNPMDTSQVDWQMYLEFNPDLVTSGITNQSLAEQHWYKYGHKENRIGSIRQLPSPTRVIDDQYLTRSIVTIVGKGPTLGTRIAPDQSKIIVAINDASNYCDQIDFLCCNDCYNFDKIENTTLARIDNILLPTYPHCNVYNSALRIYQQKPRKQVTWIKIIDQLKERGFRGRVYPYQLATAPKLVTSTDQLIIQGTLSSAGSAIVWFLQNGFRQFETIGIGTETGYSPLVKHTGKKVQSNTKQWYQHNVQNIQAFIKAYGASLSIGLLLSPDTI